MAKITFKGLETVEKQRSFLQSITNSNQNLNVKTNTALKNSARSFAIKFNNAHKRAYVENTKAWFRSVGGDYNSLIKALSFNYSISKPTRAYKGRQKYKITSVAKVDFKRYREGMYNCTIEEWWNRHPEEKQRSKKSPGEYIFNLQWKEGIMGLPQQWRRPNPRFASTRTPGMGTYTNPIFIKAEQPLFEYLYGGDPLKANRILDYELDDYKTKDYYMANPYGKIKKQVEREMGVKVKPANTDRKWGGI